MSDLKDDRPLEREIRAVLDEHAPTTPPNHLLHRFELNARRSHRLPRWLVLSKEPVMHIDTHLAVGSPTTRVAAILAATFLLALALMTLGIAGQRLMAADDTIVVAQDGSGDHATIAEAVRAADDGDRILVRPGSYVEAIVIDRDITLAGDGAAEDIVISAPADGPTTQVRADTESVAGYALHLVESDAEVSNLTFVGERSQVLATGGSPTIHDLVMKGVLQGSLADVGGSLSVSGGSTARVSRNRFSEGASIAVFDGSRPTIESNDIRDSLGILGYFGDGSVVRGNVIIDSWSAGILSVNPADIEISANEIVNPSEWGIELSFGPGADGTTVTITDNTISGALIAGVSTAGLDGLRVTGNTFRDNGTAIVWNANQGTISDNVIGAGGAGIVISQGSPEVVGNTIEGQTGRGLVVGAGASPTLRGNRSCGNAENYFAHPSAAPRLDGDNEFCEDGLPT